MLAGFKNSVTVGLSSKFATRLVSYFQPHLKYVITLPCETRKINNGNTVDVFNTIDLLLNIRICVLSSHIKCSKWPLLTSIHAQRCLCHSSVVSVTLCHKPCQTFKRRCFSSSSSSSSSSFILNQAARPIKTMDRGQTGIHIDVMNLMSVAHVSMHASIQRRTLLHLIRLKSTQTIEFIWLILWTIRQSGDIVSDSLEFCYCSYYVFHKVV